MEPWQERVVKEKEELDTKIESLNTFITENPGGNFMKLDSEARSLMRAQYDAMTRYSSILGRRIDLFRE